MSCHDSPTPTTKTIDTVSIHFSSPPTMLNSASMARPWAAVSPIDALVERATDPMLEEPNFAVNLELAEYVNSKKANT